MPIIIPSGVYGNMAFHASFSNSQVQLEQTSQNENQIQSRVRSPGGGQQQIQSQSNVDRQGQLQSLSDSSALVGLSTDVCDLNIVPFRSVSGSGSSGVQNSGAIEAQAQGPGVNQQAQLANASMAATQPFTINSSATAGDPSNPFDINASNTSPAQNSLANQILQRIQTKLKNKGFTQAQIQGSLASSEQAVGSASVRQNGTVTFNPTGPFDSNGVAPGTAQYLVNSRLTNNQGVQFNSAGNSKVNLQNNSRNAGLQANNGLALGTQAGAQGSFSSFIGIA